MADIGQPTLDQLRIFLAVADEGSFNRAARKLGRAVSVISYGVSNLEAQLGVKLFEREGSRLPRLTEAGSALLSEARKVSDDAQALVAKVRSLKQGLEAELAVAIDVMAPSMITASVLRDFQQTFPTVDMRLYVEALGAVASLVLEERASLAIGGPMIASHRELERKAIGYVELVPVAAPPHPLARAKKITPGMARQHLQLVLTDRSALTEGREFSVLSPRSWRLADLGAKHALLLEGIGWGNMPRHLVASDIAAGRLTQLNLPEKPGQNYELSAIWRKSDALGPAASWLVEAFTERLS